MVKVPVQSQVELREKSFGYSRGSQFGPEAQIPPATPPPIPNPRVLVSLVMAVALIIGGGLWLWLGKDNTSPLSYAPTPDPTAGWQTYRNEEYGFEVKYPEGWKFEVLNSSFDSSGVDGFFISKNESRLGILPKGEWGYGAICTVSDGTLNEKPVKVNDCERSKGFLTLYHFVGSIPSSWIVCGEDLKSCHRLDSFAVHKGDLVILDRILSTFRFIESADTSDWQTYRNEEYGFEVKYPVDMFIEELGETPFYGNKITFRQAREDVSVIISVKHGTEYIQDQLIWPEVYGWHSEEAVAGSSNYKAIRFSWAGNIGNYTYDFDKYIITNAGNLYEIHHSKDLLNKDVFNQILSTFRFIE